MLAGRVRPAHTLPPWTDATALFVFKDRKVGVLHDGVYKIVTPRLVLNAAARERSSSALPATPWPASTAPAHSRRW
jgi:sarcosine oxidase subunit alpha